MMPWNWTPFQKRVVYGGLFVAAMICAVIYHLMPVD